jgi:predicted DCC family thiol-disulfide oxidoreductase YuxK
MPLTPNLLPHSGLALQVLPHRQSLTPSWQIKLLYDGECPLCVREVNFLTKRDAGRGLVAFVDIADASYDPQAHGGVSFAAAMGRIHAVLPDGTVIQNVEVFRRVYEILGMGWIYAATRLPVIRVIVDWIYGIWADWRLPLTGRPDLATLIRDRQQRLDCPDNRCDRSRE